MGFCPDCRVEYVPEISQCLDCGKQLIDELPDTTNAQWTALPCVRGVLNAQMIKGALEKLHIPCYVQSLWSSRGLRVISYSFMNCVTAKVVVPRPNYNRALEVQESMIELEQNLS